MFSPRCFVSPLARVVSSLISAGLLIAAAPAAAQHSKAALSPDAARATVELAALAARYGAAAAQERAAMSQELRDAALARHGQLTALMEKDPSAVIRLAVPDATRAAMPAGLRALVEERVTLGGTVEALVEDHPTFHRTRYFAQTALGKLELHFARRVLGLESGARVQFEGVRLESNVAVSSATQTDTAPLVAATTVPQPVVVLLVNFADKPASQPYTTAFARDVVFNQTNAHYMASSFQRVSLVGDVFGWFTIASVSTTCNYSTIASQADYAATMAGVNLSAYKRRIYAFPSNACSWWGLGTVGGSPSRAWVNGSFALRVVGHELGHNFGLYHAHSMKCGTATMGTSCTTSEYGDTVDIMGTSVGHFTAFHKERLGWLPVQTITSSGNYVLDPYETITGSSKAVRVLKGLDSSGRRIWYYLEYRTSSSAPKGVMLHMATETQANTSYQLDGTPATGSLSDAAIPVGTSFTDASADVKVTVLSAGTTATVSITIGGTTTSASCTPATPSVTLKTNSTWTVPGSPLAYTMTVQNKDQSTCGSATFNLSGAVPAGWSGALSAGTMTLAPGATGTTTFKVTPPTTAPAGYYTVGATANGGSASRTATATADCVVQTGLTLGLTSDKPIYRRREYVYLTTNVIYGGKPLANAKVVYYVTRPNGSLITKTVYTGTAGNAKTSVHVKASDPLGTYSVRAVVTYQTLRGEATHTWIVQ